jgi:hypothetical protein
MNPSKEKGKNKDLKIDKNYSNSDAKSDSSNESFVNFLTKVFKGDKTDSKNLKNELKLIRTNHKNNLYKIELENETHKKNDLIYDFRTTNFFNKFKVFDKKNSSMYINCKYNLNKINQFKKENTSESKNEKNLKNNFSTFRTQIITDKKLPKKELLDKKLNEIYKRSINYKSIINENISIMKNMFPIKNINSKIISEKDNKRKIKNMFKNAENKQIDFNNETNISFKNMQDNQIYNTTFECNFEDDTINKLKGKLILLILR